MLQAAKREIRIPTKTSVSFPQFNSKATKRVIKRRMAPMTDYVQPRAGNIAI